MLGPRGCFRLNLLGLGSSCVHFGANLRGSGGESVGCVPSPPHVHFGVNLKDLGVKSEGFYIPPPLPQCPFWGESEGFGGEFEGFGVLPCPFRVKSEGFGVFLCPFWGKSEGFGAESEGFEVSTFTSG